MRLAPITVCSLAAAVSLCGNAQGERLFSEEEMKAAEASAALGAAMHKNSALKEQLLLQQNAIKSLSEAVAVANAESEIFKREAEDLKERIETLGIPESERTAGKLEQKLLAAVRDLRLAQKATEDLKTQLIKLNEASLALLNSAPGLDPALRHSVQLEIARSNTLLGAPNAPEGGAVPATLSDGMVVEVKEDLALIVANLGEQQGVKVGMPFQIWRDSKVVGGALVVDVRNSISGAVINQLASAENKIRVGDRLKVDVRQTP